MPCVSSLKMFRSGLVRLLSHLSPTNGSCPVVGAAERETAWDGRDTAGSFGRKTQKSKEDVFDVWFCSGCRGGVQAMLSAIKHRCDRSIFNQLAMSWP